MIQLIGLRVLKLNGRKEDLKTVDLRDLRLIFKNEKEVDRFVNEMQAYYRKEDENICIHKITRE
jgi:hypothetical protein